MSRTSNPMIDPSFAKIKTQSSAPFHSEVDTAAAAIAATNSKSAQKQEELTNHDLDSVLGGGDDQSGNESGDQSPATDDKGQPYLHHGKPLTNTKRAAQNRAAQKAFRQRRKDYIDELEKKLSNHKDCQSTIESLKTENLQLKEYILNLQGKLLHSTGATQAEIPGSVAGASPPMNLFNGAQGGA
ncbi:hypothetical protein CANARDRAFT_27408 [[Candida] arabinofermentans NRRL YB-2248]|uniref:Putative transcription factor kapC n=1 Tax=[Candida] arabinofermentans NRRL YB-2248 TaxID=983967 RepID=A0A1E4T345_9ASCO|nr:hypothetical protein CANARDRAFT_27408 [[Candida] arabinofermentans NRRL YB-2248]